MNTYPFSFSHLQKALLAVGSFSCLGLSSGMAYAADENETAQLATITVTAEQARAAYYQPH